MDKLYKREQRIDTRKYRVVNLVLTPGRSLDRFIEQVVSVFLEKKEVATGNLDMFTKK